jgi:hypothetical protein
MSIGTLLKTFIFAVALTSNLVLIPSSAQASPGLGTERTYTAPKWFYFDNPPWEGEIFGGWIASAVNIETEVSPLIGAWHPVSGKSWKRIDKIPKNSGASYRTFAVGPVIVVERRLITVDPNGLKADVRSARITGYDFKSGKQLWRTKISESFDEPFEFGGRFFRKGYGSTFLMYRTGNFGDPFEACVYSAKTGKPTDVGCVEGPYVRPTLVGDTLLVAGGVERTLVARSALDGRQLWSARTSRDTVVVAGDNWVMLADGIFRSGGYGPDRSGREVRNLETGAILASSPLGGENDFALIGDVSIDRFNNLIANNSKVYDFQKWNLNFKLEGSAATPLKFVCAKRVWDQDGRVRDSQNGEILGSLPLPHACLSSNSVAWINSPQGKVTVRKF